MGGSAGQKNTGSCAEFREDGSFYMADYVGAGDRSADRDTF